MAYEFKHLVFMVDGHEATTQRRGEAEMATLSAENWDLHSSSPVITRGGTIYVVHVFRRAIQNPQPFR